MKKAILAFLALALCAGTLTVTLTACGGRVPINPSSDFEYQEVTGGVAITKYVGETTKVGIPNTISGAYVVAIGHYAFANRSAITTVYVPESVTLIGSGAFNNCTGLTSIIIPDSVTIIAGSGIDIEGEIAKAEAVEKAKAEAEAKRAEAEARAKAEAEKDIAEGRTPRVDAPSAGVAVSPKVTSAFDGCLNLTKAKYKGKTYSVVSWKNETDLPSEFYDAVNEN